MWALDIIYISIREHQNVESIGRVMLMENTILSFSHATFFFLLGITQVFSFSRNAVDIEHWDSNWPWLSESPIDFMDFLHVFWEQGGDALAWVHINASC